MVHLHGEITHNGEREGTLTFCNNLDGPGQYFAKCWNRVGGWMKDGEGINQRIYMCDPWIWTIIWRLTEGGEWVKIGKKEKN